MTWQNDCEGGTKYAVRTRGTAFLFYCYTSILLSFGYDRDIDRKPKVRMLKSSYASCCRTLALIGNVRNGFVTFGDDAWNTVRRAVTAICFMARQNDDITQFFSGEKDNDETIPQTAQKPFRDGLQRCWRFYEWNQKSTRTLHMNYTKWSNVLNVRMMLIKILLLLMVPSYEAKMVKIVKIDKKTWLCYPRLAPEWWYFWSPQFQQKIRFDSGWGHKESGPSRRKWFRRISLTA